MLAVMRFCNPKPSKLLVDTYALYDEESQGIFRVVPIYFPIPLCYNNLRKYAEFHKFQFTSPFQYAIILLCSTSERVFQFTSPFQYAIMP